MPMEKRMYTKELERVRTIDAIRPIDELKADIEAGDKEKALAAYEVVCAKKEAFHHFGVRWVNQTLKNFKKYAPDEAIFEWGEDYALWCYPPCLQGWIADFKAGKATYKDFPMDEFLTNRAVLWAGLHDNEDQIWEEDEEKITFTLERCNSGGWLTTECKDPVVTLDGPDHRCYDREGFQCYCLNCTTMWEFGWYKWFGWPLFIMDVPKVGGDGKCVMVMYKDPKDIPDSYYERTGLTRKI